MGATNILGLPWPESSAPVSQGAANIRALAEKVEGWGAVVVRAGRAIPNMNLGTADPNRPWSLEVSNAGGATSDSNGLLTFTFAPFVCVGGVIASVYPPTHVLAVHNAGHDGATGRIVLRTYVPSTGGPIGNVTVSASIMAVIQRR